MGSVCPSNPSGMSAYGSTVTPQYLPIILDGLSGLGGLFLLLSFGSLYRTLVSV